jgi:hypothetical protein
VPTDVCGVLCPINVWSHIIAHLAPVVQMDSGGFRLQTLLVTSLAAFWTP